MSELSINIGQCARGVSTAAPVLQQLSDSLLASRETRSCLCAGTCFVIGTYVVSQAPASPSYRFPTSRCEVICIASRPCPRYLCGVLHALLQFLSWVRRGSTDRCHGHHQDAAAMAITGRGAAAASRIPSPSTAAPPHGTGYCRRYSRRHLADAGLARSCPVGLVECRHCLRCQGRRYVMTLV